MLLSPGASRLMRSKTPCDLELHISMSQAHHLQAYGKPKSLKKFGTILSNSLKPQDVPKVRDNLAVGLPLRVDEQHKAVGPFHSCQLAHFSKGVSSWENDGGQALVLPRTHTVCFIQPFSTHATLHTVFAMSDGVCVYTTQCLLHGVGPYPWQECAYCQQPLGYAMYNRPIKTRCKKLVHVCMVVCAGLYGHCNSMQQHDQLNKSLHIARLSVCCVPTV